MLNNILLKAMDLLEVGWCQHTAAKDGTGQVVSYDYPGACCFCLTGAIARACADFGEPVEIVIRDIIPLFKAKLRKSPIKWQDEPGRTKEEVLALIRSCL
jgi:hypothetical protein